MKNLKIFTATEIVYDLRHFFAYAVDKYSYTFIHLRHVYLMQCLELFLIISNPFAMCLLTHLVTFF